MKNEKIRKRSAGTNTPPRTELSMLVGRVEEEWENGKRKGKTRKNLWRRRNDQKKKNPTFTR